MTMYLAGITRSRGGPAFRDSGYPRAHLWEFDGGFTIPALASPHVAPEPLSDEAAPAGHSTRPFRFHSFATAYCNERIAIDAARDGRAL